MTSADRQEAMAALDGLAAKLRRPRDEKMAAIALQLQTMTEFAFAAAEGTTPGFRARFEKLHAEFCVLMGSAS